MDMLDEAAVQYRIILTKTDKVKSQDLQARIDEIEAILKTRAAAFPSVLGTSAHKGGGLDEFRAVIAGYAV